MTDGMTDSPPDPASQTQRLRNDSCDPADNREYSARLAALARFTLRHKALVIGGLAGHSRGVGVAVSAIGNRGATAVGGSHSPPRCAVTADGGAHEHRVW